jgi:hypothetical protein
MRRNQFRLLSHLDAVAKNSRRAARMAFSNLPRRTIDEAAMFAQCATTIVPPGCVEPCPEAVLFR